MIILLLSSTFNVLDVQYQVRVISLAMHDFALHWENYAVTSLSGGREMDYRIIKQP